MILKAKKPRNRYKSTSSWLDAVYRNNKAFIDEKLPDTESKTSKKRLFKQIIKDYVEEDDLTYKQAVAVASRSTTFTEVKERLVFNAYKALKKDEAAYREFRELTKEQGRYTKINFDEFVWDKDSKSYVYGKKLRVYFRNSPKDVVVEEIA